MFSFIARRNDDADAWHAAGSIDGDASNSAFVSSGSRLHVEGRSEHSRQPRRTQHRTQHQAIRMLQKTWRPSGRGPHRPKRRAACPSADAERTSCRRTECRRQRHRNDHGNHPHLQVRLCRKSSQSVSAKSVAQQVNGEKIHGDRSGPNGRCTPNSPARRSAERC